MSTRDRVASWVAAAATLAAVAAGLYWGTNAVGGSDSHCYVAQARMYAAGQSALPLPFGGTVGWPNAAATFAPSGYTAGASPAGSVPLCPAGLPYLMVVAMWLGGASAWFWVVPVLGALGVWSTYRLGTHVADRSTGAAAAVLVGCSPVFLFQLFQPMSDVPAAALWVAALALATRGLTSHSYVAQDFSPASAAAAGLTSALAIMVRPNLAPLAIVPALLVSWRGTRLDGRAAITFCASTIPGIVAVAAQQRIVYGSPLRSGYGSLDNLFSLANIAPNLQRYAGWMVETHGPVLALALAAPFLLRPRRVSWLLLAFAAATAVAYLPYVPFDNWSFARFLLPAIPVLIVLTAAAVGAAAGRLGKRPAVSAAAVAVFAVVAGVWWVQLGRDLRVFDVKSQERKYPALGAYVSAQLPGSAVVLAAQPAGAVRFYAGRPTVSWDAVDPAWLDRVDAELRSRGLEPYLAVEAFEMDRFREQFREHSVLGQLDWPPRAIFGRAISLYRLDDRPRYLRGERIPTERFDWPAR